jgi:hypothetical protein
MLPEAIKRRIDRRSSATGCWLWTGALSDGYGRCHHEGRLHRAHRLTFELLAGPIPQGDVLDHLCRVRHCVNPAHLEAVTIGENVLRGTGPVAVHARQTHCRHGHLLSGDNLIVWATADGRRHRRCRSCRSATARRSRERPEIRARQLAYWKAYNATRRTRRVKKEGVPT